MKAQKGRKEQNIKYEVWKNIKIMITPKHPQEQEVGYENAANDNDDNDNDNYDK